MGAHNARHTQLYNTHVRYERQAGADRAGLRIAHFSAHLPAVVFPLASDSPMAETGASKSQLQKKTSDTRLGSVVLLQGEMIKMTKGGFEYAPFLADFEQHLNERTKEMGQTVLQWQASSRGTFARTASSPLWHRTLWHLAALSGAARGVELNDTALLSWGRSDTAGGQM